MPRKKKRKPTFRDIDLTKLVVTYLPNQNLIGINYNNTITQIFPVRGLNPLLITNVNINYVPVEITIYYSIKFDCYMFSVENDMNYRTGDVIVDYSE